jgi:Zn-dependent peptidase ImmA (M78 family)
VDSRADADRRHAILAHEVGHLVLGHYERSDDVWFLTDGAGADEWEIEADLFAFFALRSRNQPLDRFIR